MTPTLPLYVKSLGGSASAAGWALFAFSVPSFLVRPIMGHACDRWGGMMVLAVGVGVLAVGGLLYLLPFLAAVFAALRPARNRLGRDRQHRRFLAVLQ